MSYQIGNLDLGVAFRADLGELQAKLGQAGGAVEGFGKKAGGALREVAKEAGHTDDSMQRLANGIKGAFVGGSVAVGLIALKNQITGVAGALIEAQVQLDRLRNGFNFGTGGPAAGARELAFVRLEANRLGLEINGTAQQYMKLVAASRGSSLAGAQTREVFKAIAEASTVMGLGVEQSERAFMAVGQMMSKGKVQAEELRGQLGEHLPGAFGIAARAMNMTEAELNKFMETGNLLAQDFLPKFAMQLRQELAGSVEEASKSMQASLNRMSTSWTNFKQQLVQSGIGDAIKAEIDGLAGQINVLGDSLEASRQRGNGLWLTLGNASATAGASVAVEAYERSINKANLMIYGLTNGVLGFNQSIDATPDFLRPTDEALKSTSAKLRDAGLEYDRLTERLKIAPDNIYIKSELSNLARYIGGLREAQKQYQGLISQSSLGGGRGVINPMTVGEMDQRQQAALKAFGDKYATPQQKMLEEIEKQKAALGNLYSPEIEAKIRAHYIKPMAAAAEYTSGLVAKIEAAQQYLGRLQTYGAEADKLTDGEKEAIKIRQELTGSLTGSARALRVLALADAERLIVLEKGIKLEQDRIKAAEESAKAMTRIQEEDARANNASFEQALKRADGLREQVLQQERLNSAIGLTKEAAAQLEGARLRDDAAQQMRNAGLADDIDLSGQLGNLYRSQAEALEKLARLKESGALKQASTDAAAQAAADWRRTAETIEQSLTDALMRGFESGKGFAQNLRDTLKNMFGTLVLRPVIQAVVGGVTGLGGASAMAGGAGGAGGLGLAGAASNLQGMYSAFAGGIGNLGASIGGMGASLQYGTAFGSQQSAMLAAQEAGMGTMTGNMASMGPSFGALGGALVGVMAGKMISGGYSAIGKSGNAAVGVGTGIGLLVGGPIGAAIGGAIGGVVNRAFGMGAKKITDEGLTGTFGPGGASLQGFSDFSQKGGLFRSDKSGRNFSGVSSELDMYLDRSLAALRVGAAGYAQAIGLSADAVNSFSSQMSISLKGLDDAGRQQAIDGAVTDFADQMANAVLGTAGQAFVRAGETASQTLQRLGTSLTGVNNMLGLMGHRLLDVDLRGADAASSLADLFGGIDGFTQATAAYYNVFHSAAERQADQAEQMRLAMARLGLQAPRTQEEFRALVETQAAAGASAHQTYAALVQLAPAFDALTTATKELAQQTAQKLIARFTGGTGLVPALRVTAADLAAATAATGAFSGQVYTIHRLLGDASSGTLTFGDRLGQTTAALDPAQLAVAKLQAEMLTLSAQAGGTMVDMAGLSTALANVDTTTFVATVTSVFERIGERVKGVLGGIASERAALRESAIGMIGAPGLSPEQIRAQIAGSPVGLPSNAGVVSAQAALASADQAMRLAGMRTAAGQELLQEAINASQASQASLASAQILLQTTPKEIWASLQRTVGSDMSYGGTYTETFRTMVANPEHARAQAALQAATDRAAAATLALASAQSQVSEQTGSIALAQAAAAATQTTAANAAKQAQLDYIASLQKYSVDASRAVTQLGRLREETVRYHDAQKALGTLMTGAADTLRASVAAIRFDQLDPRAQLASLEERFNTAYSMALSTSGETLAKYGQELNSLLNPLIQAAQAAGLTGVQYSNLINTSLARAEATAGRLDANAPQNYQAESLGLLGAIDSTLAAIEAGALTADQMIVRAIEAGKDSTAAGLRAVVAALTGQAVPAFATGAAFSGGVVSRPTLFNMGLMGEAGDEGILPLANVGGRLGVHARTGGNDNAALVAEVRQLRQVMSTLMEQTVVNTGKQVRKLDRWDIDGVPVRSAPEGLLVRSAPAESEGA